MDAEPWSSSHRFLTRIEETVAEYRSRDIHLHTHPIVLRSCEAGRLCRWTQFLSIGTPQMPHNALEWHVSVQMNVTRDFGRIFPICQSCLCQSIAEGLLYDRIQTFRSGWRGSEAKVKREESLQASSPQRLNFSRRRMHIPVAMPSCNSSRQASTTWGHCGRGALPRCSHFRDI